MASITGQSETHSTAHQIETPIGSNRCAVIIPIYKPTLPVVEDFCLKYTLLALETRDVFFLAPHGLDVSRFSKYKCKILFFSQEIFLSVESYSRWLMTPEIYLRFSAYERLLICQTDAIILTDDLDDWVSSHWDYIGAPWWGAVQYTPKHSRCHPELVGKSFALQVGNGGLSLRNPRKIMQIILSHREFIKELLSGDGDQVNEDALLAILGIVDKTFKIPGCKEAARFSLELNARESILTTGKLPMGFHALFKYDPSLFDFLFPEAKLQDHSI